MLVVMSVQAVSAWSAKGAKLGLGKDFCAAKAQAKGGFGSQPDLRLDTSVLHIDSYFASVRL